MNRKDRDSFIIIAFIMFCILLTAAFYTTSKLINPLYIIIVISLLQTFYIIPKIVQMFFEFNKLKAGLSRYIPFLNETMIFTKKYALATIISWVVIVIFLTIASLKLDFISLFMKEKYVYNYTYNAMRVVILVYIINNVVRGLSWNVFVNFILIKNNELMGVVGKNNAVQFYYRVVVFIPIVRIFAFVWIYSILHKIIELNHFKDGDSVRVKIKEVRVDE